jgi:RNA polymerase sigma-70 factor (ECF subfamily)
VNVSLQKKRRDVIAIEQEILTERLRLHDESAYQELFSSYAKLLWAVAGSILSGSGGTAQDTEECVSDVFISLWNNPEGFDPLRGSMKSYLCQIAKNKAIDRCRAYRKQNVVRLEDYMETVTDDDALEIPDYSRLYEEIRALPEPTREIMVRRYFHDEKPAKIAERLGLPKKEIENRLYRGKKALSVSLADYREVR